MLVQGQLHLNMQIGTDRMTSGRASGCSLYGQAEVHLQGLYTCMYTLPQIDTINVDGPSSSRQFLAKQ